MIAKFNYKLFGLEPRDLRVYEAMLTFDQAASIRTIAELVKINRGTTFEIIKKLTNTGLVGSFYRNKRKYYAAQPPESLQKYADYKHNQVAEQLGNIEAYVKSLQSRKRREEPDQFTQFYDGEDEIATLLRDVLETVEISKDKTYRVISSAQIRNQMYAKFRNFTTQRIKRGIFARVIAIGKEGEEAALSERRLLSTKQSPACYVIVYGTKVAQISLSEIGGLQGVIVNNAGVAHLQELVFDNLWESLNS